MTLILVKVDKDSNQTTVHLSTHKAVVRPQLHPLGPADQLTRATPLIKEKVI